MNSYFWKAGAKPFYFLALLVFTLSGCRVGEDDPFLSLRSRDNRLKANWKMNKLTNRLEISNFEPGAPAVKTVIVSEYDGYEMRVKTYVNDLLARDSTFGFSYQMALKDDGEVTYDYTVIYFGLAGLKSDGKDNWYWLQADKKKSRVYLGNALQFPITAGLPVNLPGSFSVALASLITDFGVEGLRNEELRLSFNKASNQVTGSGGFQQLLIDSKMEFIAK